MFLSFGNRLRLTFIPPDSLLLENPRLTAFLDAMGIVVAVILWYVVIGNQPSSLANWLEHVRVSIARDPIVALFLAFPLVLIPVMVGRIRVIVRGSKVLFDASTHQILINNRTVASFRDVSSVRVTKVNGIRGSSHCELCIDLKGRRWLEIDTHGTKSEYVIAANAIANVIQTRVEENER